MQIKKIYSVFALISLFGLLVTSFSFNQSFSKNISNDDNDTNIKSYLLSKILEAEIDKVSTILEITSKSPEIRKSPNATLLSETIETYNGIPELSEQEKRNVLKNIVLNYDDISGAAFLMPNGDMYIREPFYEQLNLNKSNLSFRDYYKGALESGTIYMDNVIISVATGKPIAVTAIPVFANDVLENSMNDREIVGLIYSTLNFNVPNQLLESLNLTNSERVVYLDHLGNKIADSSMTAPQNEISIFSNLQSFNNAISGMSGNIIEDVNNTKMIISYAPVNAVQNTWSLLWMKPYSNDVIDQ